MITGESHIEWDANKLLNAVEVIIEDVTRSGAEAIADDARSILKNAGYDELASQIEVKESKFKEGGFIIIAQGPGNYTKYYASFVELGHFSSVYGKYKRGGAKSLKGISPVHIKRKPYLRPALANNKKKILRDFKDELAKI